METWSSKGKRASIVLIVEHKYHIAIAGKYNSWLYQKTFMRQE